MAQHKKVMIILPMSPWFFGIAFFYIVTDIVTKDSNLGKITADINHTLLLVMHLVTVLPRGLQLDHPCLSQLLWTLHVKLHLKNKYKCLTSHAQNINNTYSIASNTRLIWSTLCPQEHGKFDMCNIVKANSEKSW